MNKKIALIKKLAQELSLDELGGKNTSDVEIGAPPPKANPTKAVYHDPSALAVKTMQETMKSLALAVEGMSPMHKLQPEDKAKEGFKNFITDQYLTDQKDQSQVVNSLKGLLSSTFKIDGGWGSKTNEALNQIYAFAYGLLQLEGDFGLNNKIYNAGNLNEFKQLLTDGMNLKGEEKKERATQITAHLKAILNLYKHFEEQMLSKAELRTLVEGTSAFEQYTNKSAPNTLTVEDEQLINNEAKLPISYVAPKQPNKKLDYLPLSALTSKENYLKWMTETAGLTENMAMQVFNNVIKPKVEA